MPKKRVSVKTSEACVLLILSDLHSNHIGGLCTPTTEKADGGTYRYNPLQRGLWKIYQRLQDDVDAILKAHGYPLHVVWNGDIVEFDAKKRTAELIHYTEDRALELVVGVAEPLVQRAETNWVTKGTGAHTGKSSWGDDAFADDIGAVPDSDLNNPAWWQLRRKFGGVKFDIAHHTTIGGKMYTYPSAPGRNAVNEELSYYRNGEELPDFVVRSHVHRFSDSGTTLPVRWISTPCLQIHSSFGKRIGSYNQLPDIGAVAWVCKDGLAERFIPLIYKFKRSNPWRN